ncbi:MAG: NYN domain-containing protein [Candidatus Accumulibacter sp.]|jgi:uncharacterized protein (TIGR00288 family)|nr:NYN domain-containing protein [Accumulibacter sp.]
MENNDETRVAILVDCDNVSPAILEYALLMAAQFGRIALRRGYGNQGTLGNKWQEVLVCHAFTPCLQYQYASGKNTADIALALDAQEAMFDRRADTFCLVTSDSDFAYLCRKLRERGATVCIVGESKTPSALRNASDQFFEWAPESADSVSRANGKNKPETVDPATTEAPAKSAGRGRKTAKKETPAKPEATPKPAAATVPTAKGRPLSVVKAVSLLANETSEGKVGLGALGQYLKRTDPAFSPKKYGHSSLLTMIKTYDLLAVKNEKGGHWVGLAEKGEPVANAVDPLPHE